MPRDEEDKEPIVEVLEITKTQKELITNAYVRIAVAENYIKQFEGIMRFVGIRVDSEEVQNSLGIVHQALFMKLNSAFKDFFMMANIFPEMQAAARKMAKEKCSDRFCLGHLTDPEGSFNAAGDEGIVKAIQAAIKARED